ncbi:MAG: DUF5682 family protein [Acetatifactor sp.]
METILRSEEMAEIMLLPVRHHSPACSLHVTRMIEEWKPDEILIEGPDNANKWIPVMVHEDTRAPFAVYYSYDDTTGLVSSEKEKYKCYYPFLDYSPELVALRAGAKKGIHTAFIDMPYGDILAASREGKGLLKEAEKSNYNDDYLLAESTYVRRLCEKTGMRSFDEFWEKYFELEGPEQDSVSWFDRLLLHCELSRAYSSEEELRAEGCLQRETYMAERILEVLANACSQGKTETTYRKVLVITGGFHTPALRARLLSIRDREAAGMREPCQEKLRRVPQKDQGVYLMPYSMEAADALNGYASGMPYSGFYQLVWEMLTAPDAGEREDHQGAYEAAVLHSIVRLGKAVRSREGGISTYDEICACSMAQGLGALRGKKQPGAYELQDAVLSCFVKGEHTIATDFPMQELRRQMTGSRIGELCKHSNEPPILQDFRARCRKYGLKIASTIGEEVTLAVFSKKKHRMISMFFHQVTFLNTTFAKREKGPDLQSGRDRNLMREIWQYRWNTQVMAALIDASVYGGSVEEAVLGMVKQELRQELTAGESALLLSKVFEMGLEEQLEAVCERVYELLLKDTDFYSLTNALRTLSMLEELCGLYQSAMDLQELLEVCCRRAIGLLPAMTRVRQEELTECMGAMKTLYQVTGRGTLPDAELLREDFLHALLRMTEDKEIQAGIDGCVHGILYGSQQESPSTIEKLCRGYLTGTKEQSMQIALFFRGLFFAAKDLVFVGQQFLEMLDAFLCQIETEDFMRLLPEFRLAFTYFTPAETDRIAAVVAAMHGKGREDILQKQAVPELTLRYGREVDVYVAERLAGQQKQYEN